MNEKEVSFSNLQFAHTATPSSVGLYPHRQNIECVGTPKQFDNQGILNILILILIMHVNVYIHYACAPCVIWFWQRPKEGIGSLGPGITHNTIQTVGTEFIESSQYS